MYEYLNVTYTPPPPHHQTGDDFSRQLFKVKASKVVYSNKNLKKKLLIYKKINNADFWIPTNVRLEMLIGLHLLPVEPVNVRTSAPGENVQNICRTSGEHLQNICFQRLYDADRPPPPPAALPVPADTL